jgi:hypothetical protein
MEAQYELRSFSITGIRLVLALIALVLMAAAGGYALRAFTSGLPVSVAAQASNSRTALSYDEWVHDLAAERAAQMVPEDSKIPAGSTATEQAVPEDSHAPSNPQVQVHEGR